MTNQDLIAKLKKWSNGCYTGGGDGEPEGCPGMMEFQEIISQANQEGGREAGDTMQEKCKNGGKLCMYCSANKCTARRYNYFNAKNPPTQDLPAPTSQEGLREELIAYLKDAEYLTTTEMKWVTGRIRQFYATRHPAAPVRDGLREEMKLPWRRGNTGEDQFMFLNSDDDYCGSVQIRQFQGRGSYDEPRRITCGDFILKAVNAYNPAVAPESVEPSKHYKCPKCHTRFTREYPYKPSDTKVVESLEELAKRKGIRKIVIAVNLLDEHLISLWYDSKRLVRRFVNKSYKQSEFMARAYLSALRDIKQEGR